MSKAIVREIPRNVCLAFSVLVFSSLAPLSVPLFLTLTLSYSSAPLPGLARRFKLLGF